jgi:hypothetical protein
VSDHLPPITEVTGGSHGMTVACDHALVLAGAYDDAGDRMRLWAEQGGRVLVDRDLLASAVLAPASFAEAEAAVLAATTGPDGILVASGLWEADALTIRVAVRATQLGDELVASAWDRLVRDDVRSAAVLLSGLYSDAGPVTVPTSLTVAGGDRPPADLAGLLGHLAAVSALSDRDHPENNGTIEVQTIRAADGMVRHIVYLPGADDLLTAPGDQDDDVRDLGTSLQLATGQDNAYQQGVLEAMRQAGIKPGEPVALVGHSQGGMTAAAILSQGSPFDVTHVVTAGSPTAQVDGFPPGSHVLSLENRGDVGPLLDGQHNPDSAQQVTVRFDGHEMNPGANHDLDHYIAGAEAAEASADPSIQDELASLAAEGFVGPADGQEVASQVFQITR